MITVLGTWERWDDTRLERRLWKQVIQAFGVDQWAMSGIQDEHVTTPRQYQDLAGMLDDHPGPKTFLIPPGRRSDSQALTAYKHPDDAIYVFGCGGENLVRYVTSEDDVVSIHVPHPRSELFACTTLPVVLYARMVKL